MEKDIVLRMTNISKSFPGVKALQNVDFALRKGEIHALMGENGAGKSTLIKVLTGVYSMDEGKIQMGESGENIVNRSPQEAQEHGISTVYQEVNLCPNLSVAENLFIGREPRKLGFIDWRSMNKQAEELLKSLDITAGATDKLEECSIAKQQMIAIARAVAMKCQVLILDEPTSSLDDEEVEKLFVLMRRLREQGVGIIFVTHFLEQVYEVCDRITVLRNGKLVGEYPVQELPRVELVAKMMGKKFDDLADIKGSHKQLEKFEPVIEVPEVKASSKEAKINGLETLPEGYVPEYVVTDANGEEVSEFKVDNDTITWTDGIAAGSYTLNVSDQSGKYASFEKDYLAGVYGGIPFLNDFEMKEGE